MNLVFLIDLLLISFFLAPITNLNPRQVVLKERESDSRSILLDLAHLVLVSVEYHVLKGETITCNHFSLCDLCCRPLLQVSSGTSLTIAWLFENMVVLITFRSIRRLVSFINSSHSSISILCHQFTAEYA